MTRTEYIRAIRRAIESDDLVTAETLSVELDALLGDPDDDDRHPAETQVWGTAI